MSNTTTQTSQNPTINKSGEASINSGQFCIWETASGSVSSLTINNSSRANTLSIGITGAPTDGIIVSVNGESQSSLNGFFELPPNTPTYVIKAQGDFKGQNVTIMNNTNSQNDATAEIQAQTTK